LLVNRVKLLPLIVSVLTPSYLPINPQTLNSDHISPEYVNRLKTSLALKLDYSSSTAGEFSVLVGSISLKIGIEIEIVEFSYELMTRC
jgi:hypothetical protein